MVNSRYRVTTYQDRATVTDTRTGRSVTATKHKKGVSLSGKLPEHVKRAVYHTLTRSAY